VKHYEKNIFMLQGSPLATENLLVLRDADAVTSNQYSIRLLNDTSNALNIVYNILPIEHHLRPDQAPSTAIFPGKYISSARLNIVIILYFMSYFIPFDKCSRVPA